MKIYEVKVYLYEGDVISLGCFTSEEDAEEWKKEAIEDWAGGSNVEAVLIHERDLK